MKTINFLRAVIIGIAVIAPRTTPAGTVTWVGGSADWNTATNWSTGDLPGTEDDVVIGDGAAITVTHSSGTHAVKSVQSQQAFTLSGGTLTVSNTLLASRTFTLSGGTLGRATVTTTNGTAFLVQNGTLDGVTVNGVLDVGSSYSGASLTVTNGLVLNGTARVGSTNNSNYGSIKFGGSQSLSGNGTVVFGNHSYYHDGMYGYNALWLDTAGTTLTIGPGITVRGQNGYVGAYTVGPWSGPANVNVVNQGTIETEVAGGRITINGLAFTNQGALVAAGGTVIINSSVFSNQGLAQAVNGGTVTLNFTWSNTGILAVGAASILNLGGTITGVGTLTGSNGTVNLTGKLDNTGNSWALDATTVTLSGTIKGGTVAMTNGAALVVSYGGTLDGVTVNGMLDVGYSVYGASLTVTNGLVLNGTARVGGTNDSNYGSIKFAGSQSLSGNGTVVFGNNNYNAYGIIGWNALWLDTAGTTLTIGPGITVRGQNGYVGAYTVGPWSGPANVSVFNQGTITTDVAGGRITITGQAFSNQGTVAAAASGGGMTINAQTFTNQGTLVAEVAGGVVVINSPVFSNQGLAQAVNGGTVTLNFTWSNTGTLAVGAASTLNLGGTFTGVGTLTSTNGTVNLTGKLDNTGSSWALDATTVLLSGTIKGGTVAMTNGAALVVSYGGTLDGVTVNGMLDVGYSVYGASLTVTNGLVLNGTARVGGTNISNYSSIKFAGGQSLSGNGTVVFGNNNYNAYGIIGWNALWLDTAGTTLTIGPGITVRGQNGYVGAYTVGPWSGPANVSVVNQGTITADVAGGRITLTGQTFTNQGTLVAEVAGSTITVGASSFQNVGIIWAAGGTVALPASNFQNTGTLEASSGGVLQVPQMPSTEGNIIAMAGGTVNLPTTIYFNGVNRLSSQVGGTVQISGSLLGNTRNLGQFNPLGTLILNGSGNSSSPQLLEVMGQNFGTSPVGFIHNFTYGTLTLANNTYVRLIDQYDNSPGTGAEVLYVNSLVVPAGCTLDLNGLRVYARAAQLGGSVLRGTVTTIPNSGPVGFSEPTLGNIAVGGQVDEWTFFARAGQSFTVLVNPGSGSGVPPYLGWVEARLLDTNDTVFASNTNASNGQSVLLANVGITNDGIYRVQVHASPVSPASTGHYQVTVWPTTPNVADLVLNQTVVGDIQTPYSVDQWNFVATAGQIVRFHLVNISSVGVGFDLKGPGGWIGFSNIVADSDFVPLPASGNYSLIAHSLSGQYGVAYAFQLLLAGQANLPLGMIYQGQWAGSGQAGVVQFNLPAGAPMLITVNNLVANNHCEVYARFGQPPTRSTYDYRAATPGTPNQQILTTMATAGSWYVLVYGDNIQAPGDFTLQVTSAAVLLTSVTPERSGRNAPIMLTISGAGFDGSSSVQLVDAGGTAYPAAWTEADSFSQITATFSAGTLAPGTYSLRVARSAGGSATLTDAFQVLTGGLANFSTELSVPRTIGFHAPATILSQYRNSGDAAMPAPLLVLTAKGAGREGAFLTTDASALTHGLWTSGEPSGFSHAIQFLGCGQTPGVLQPGEAFQVPVYYAGWQLPWFEFSSMDWNLGVLKADDPTPVDWASLKDGMKPASISAEAWDALWAGFTAGVGTTWGDYVRMLDDNAAYLGRLGLRVVDVSQLLAFKLIQADGLTPLRTLADSVDASVEAPGLPLVFRRSFAEPISQRFVLGPLGRGWSHNWQYSLTKASDGTVTIFGPGGSQRVFQPDSRSGNYFTQAGDHATLTALGGGAFTLEEKSGVLYTYQADGKLSFVEDLNGNRITLGYAGNLLTTLTHSSGQSLQITYNGAGRIQAITDHFGRQTLLSYDGANEHLTGAQYFDGRTAGYTYNLTPGTGLHALTQVASSCCNRRYFDYDAQGRLTGTHLEGNAEAVTFTYENTGKVTVTDALGHASKFYFDHRGLLAKTEDALGNSVHLAFDDAYNLVSIMDPTGRSYSYAYDAHGNMVRSVDPLGHATQFSFTNVFNRLTSVTDARSNATCYGYDYNGNLKSITYADGSVENWSYDFLGNPETWSNRRANETFYTYNNNGQVTAKYFVDGAVTDYAYDARGNVTNATTYDTILNPLESVSMTYDASNRLTRMDYPGGKFLTFTYDATWRRASSVDQLGHRLGYFYDAAGRLQSLTNELDALVVLYRYDPAGRVARKTLGSCVFTDYEYDPVGQLLNMTNFLTDGTVLSRFNYTYDSRSRRTSMDTLDGRWTYDYDDIGQLTRAVFASTTTNIPDQNIAFIYDEVGNRKQTVENGVTNQYTANNLNQYVERTEGGGQRTDYTFDADGNLIREVSPQGTTTYTYSDENRLVAMTSPQGTWQYGYDGLGNRVAKTENGTLTRYTVDPIGLGNVVGEYDGVGNLLAHYDHALGLLSRTDAGGNAAGYTFDAIGNVQELVTAAGTIVNRYAYTPFGTSLRRTEALPNPFQYVGQFGVMKEGNGLDYMRARQYEPSRGRFCSMDPLNLLGGDGNLYRYVWNSPTLQSDPSGLGHFVKWFLFNGDASSLVTYAVLLNAYADWGNLELVHEQYVFNNGDNIGFGNGGSNEYYDGNKSSLFSKVSIPTGAVPTSGEFRDDVMQKALQNLIDRGYGQARYNGYLFNCQTWAELLRQEYERILQAGGGGSSGTSTSTDPNQLTGPAGFGPHGFVSSSAAFAYRIDFENTTNATAPAQQVVITDTLSTNFDWSTFAVTELGLGDLLLVLPPNTQHFETNVPVTYLGGSFQVQIQVGINPASGLLTATFRSIDPATSLPPPVNIGFLPPEDGTGRGQGHVSFSINARAGLSTGTSLRNVALISFDNQASIATNQKDPLNPAAGTDPLKECLNTIDAGRPTSHVLPLPAQSQLLQIPISWTGQDDASGSGVASYDVYVTDNGGAWTLWQSATTSTNASFRGQPQHTYGFYSVARDNAGGLEAPHLTADATTTVVANPLLQLTLTPAATNLNVSDTFSYTLTVKNAGSLSLSNVVMSNAIPAGVALDWVSYGRGVCSIGDDWIQWSIGNMTTNLSASMNITATAVANGTWTNAFLVADSDGAASSTVSQRIQIGAVTSPVLTVTRTNNQVVLSWPAIASTYHLESTTNLVSLATWTTVTNVPVTVNSQQTVTLPTSGVRQFFRLHSQ